MGLTPDRAHGVSDEEGTVYSDEGVLATAVGEVRYKGTPDNRFSMFDAGGEFNPNSAAGSGVTETQHRALRALIHFIDDGPTLGFASGAYKETLPAGSLFPTLCTWWESSAKAEKIVELTVVRNTNQTPKTEEWKVYGVDGTTVLETVTDTFTYQGIVELTRTRTIA